MASLLILIIVIAIVTDENSHGHSIPLGSWKYKMEMVVFKKIELVDIAKKKYLKIN